MKRLCPIIAAVIVFATPVFANSAESGTAHLIGYLGKFHPVAVHLPIAMMLGAFLAELLFVLTHKGVFRAAVRFNLYFAVLGAVAAIPLGFAAASGTTYPHDYARVLAIHRTLGLCVLGCSLGAAFMLRWTDSENRGGVLTYRLLLLAGVLLVGLAGHFGASLVYGLDYLAW